MTAAANAHTAVKDLTAFWIEKVRLRAIFVGVQLAQKRDDISGKFAKKLGRQRRALAKADEEVTAQRNDLLDAHTVKDDKGDPVPVYAVNEDGSPVFKKDAAGNATTERVVVPNEVNLKDRKLFEKELKALLGERILVECPAFLVQNAEGGIPDLERFKAVKGDLIDVLMDLEEDADTTRPPLALVETSAEAEAPVVEATAANEEGDRSAP